MNPSFKVSAECFYAMAAHLPTQITAERRYRLASLEDEQRIVNALRDAITADVVDANAAGVINGNPALTPEQAARRLRALGAGTLNSTRPEFQVQVPSAIGDLVTAWLGFQDADITGFWAGAMPAHAAAHLELVLVALTRNHAPLITAIQNELGIADVAALVALPVTAPAGQPSWRRLFFPEAPPGQPTPPPRTNLLPPFTAPGSPEERFQAFVRHLRNFFELVSTAIASPAPPTGKALPQLERSFTDALQLFVDAYGAALAFGAGLNETDLEAAVTDVFPDDPMARAWLEQAARTIDVLYGLADIGVSDELRFSIAEALYARGFTDRQSVAALSSADFRTALTGTVAYDYAAGIHLRAQGAGPVGQPTPQGFRPINSDGLLANCIPPPHLSPLGHVSYLQEMLGIMEVSTCDEPEGPLTSPEGLENTLEDLIAGRRGPLSNLHVTAANLATQIPLIDRVNECLEALAANEPDPAPHGVVYDTNGKALGGHNLQPIDAPATSSSSAEFLHDPVTLFEVLPEHSSPATPVKQPAAYDKLRDDFSAPTLPYSQPLDVCRSYLNHLRTSRYATMRRFRQDITEFVLDPAPAAEPPGFQRHLWRYPVRIEIAREYLGITPEEYDALFTQDLAPPGAAMHVRTIYGFISHRVNNVEWTDIVVRVSEFLKRTGLSYCQFLDVWRSKFVEFHREGVDPNFPDCEPCYLDDLIIDFDQPRAVNQALKQLAVFIRLWQKLQQVKGAAYPFVVLRDICEVFQLFQNDNINPDFIRQLAAFQILRDHLSLQLADEEEDVPEDAFGADRTHLLTLWGDPGHPKFDWAVDEFLDQIQHYAQARHHCGCRPPEFIKLLASNLDSLSRLAGFDPGNPTDTWRARPTHTLRFAEVLAKLYASDFGVGEVLFLFTTDAHLAGDDPFPLQSDNEALESPLGLPDDEHTHSVWRLRWKLLKAEVPEEVVKAWTWARIDAVLRQNFGYAPSNPAEDRLVSLGQHFFPTILESEGYEVEPLQRQYRVTLADSPELMWNTPPGGPFRYDPAPVQELWTELPLSDEAVLAKLSRIRQLVPDEQRAVRELYFLPRVDLVPFAFLFTNFGEAEERLIQESDENKRWNYFQRAFALCYERCRIITEHLASHVTRKTGQSNDEGGDLAWRLLQHLFADENKATAPWESDGGQVPEVTWKPQPNGGAFAALLGLVGTGLLGEFMPEDENHELTFEDDTLIWPDDAIVWREVRGPMDAFGSEENSYNAPIATVLPFMDLQISWDKQRFVTVRNGFALSNPDGALLGAAQGFAVRWRGLLLIEREGPYQFKAGAPTAAGEEPDLEGACRSRWRVTLKRGQKTWFLLSHQWPDVEAPPDCSEPLELKCGTYQLAVEFIQPEPSFSRPEEVCPQTTGFQLKYTGPDSEDQLVAIPLEKLFRDRKDTTLGDQIALPGDAGADRAYRRFLDLHFTSSLRDIRRTYQRAFKALLFAHRFGLSAQPDSDDGQSEIGYMLTHARGFAGRSYFRDGAGFATHLAFFDFNFLPILDNYLAPTVFDDQRLQPSLKRRQALFDWWERVFDYTTVLRSAKKAPEPPLWLLFHEAAERHTDPPAHLLRHMGVDLRHTSLVLKYYQGFSVLSEHLEDERWAIRVWRAETWIRDLLLHFSAKDIREARPELWAADDPSLIEPAEPVSGNSNLTKFVRDGYFENDEPRRYLDIKALNEGLRDRARRALLAYLCGMNRIVLPWGGQYATEPKHLSELLLLDVEVGLCQRASRIEEAISVVQTFVQRARLGLEPGFAITPAFVLLWDRRFITFHVWETCKRREVYRENWIDWDKLQQARRGEAFRFLESELRRTDLTMPVPGGLEYWPDQLPPDHPSLMVLQAREPALIQQLRLPPEGFDLLGAPERHARPSWLAALGSAEEVLESPEPEMPPDEELRLPFWIQAAIRLGTRFLRVAAAGLPPASSNFEPHDPKTPVGCCVECGKYHPPVMDEYYFWLIDSRHLVEQEQNADWGADPQDPTLTDWHRKDRLPSLLHWPQQHMVHLAWCRVHNGEFQPPRRSDEGVRLAAGVAPDSATPELEFLGRLGDSLQFEVIGGDLPPGFTAPPNPGFRYDLAADTAVVLPEVVPSTAPTILDDLLPAYPFFVYFSPGVPLMPTSLFSPAVAVAGWLRAHCRFEAALKWYELVYNPLSEDSTWESPDAVDQDRALTLHYLDTLFEWGDALMHRNSPEAFQQARLVFDTAEKILGPHPHTVILTDDMPETQTVGGFEPLPAPLNPRLLTLYERIKDRLALIHACINARRLRNGQPNKDMSYWGNSPLSDGWQTTRDICADEEDWCYAGCLPYSPYRFLFLVAKAQELANEVRALGTALLAAFEKGDAEYLASLRATHERQLLNLALENRQNQWREADWQVQALRKTQEIARANRRYYQLLIDTGLIGGELHYEAETDVALAFQLASQISEGIAEGVSWIPDINIGTVGPCPTVINHLPLGSKLGGIFATAARITNSLANSASTRGSLSLTQGGWVRREDEWRHQVEVLDIEIEQIERQILAAERRRDVALRELNNHRRQMEHAGEVQDFLRDKFTNHALYLWLQQENAALHYQMYELARNAVRQAQRAFNFESGHLARNFLTTEPWDDLHEGLLAGERLQLALRRMEKAYLDENCREYELTKHISLRLHFPMQLLQIKEIGYCEIEIPEWMFDLDYPGHYMRRIKNVTLTIPCVVGPYTGVHCRLTLLSSITRVDPRLPDMPHSCCANGTPNNGYEALPDDPRIVAQYAAVEAIATSSGQNDAGMFEINFRDERYLPFEFAGAVSRWRIELPKENNYFDFDTLSDIVIHLNYTAREGGELLRDVANRLAQQNLPGAGWRFFDAKHEFPDSWRLLSAREYASRPFRLLLGRNMFPFLPGSRDILITRLAILFEVLGAEGRAQYDVDFTPNPQLMLDCEPECDCRPAIVRCFASAEWPNLYHGVIEVRLGPLSQSGSEEVGTFDFPCEMGEISRAFLLCGYEARQGRSNTGIATPRYWPVRYAG